MFKYQNQNGKKKWEKTFSVTKRGNKRLKNRGIFRDFKSGQKKYKSGKGFQIGAKRFQIGSEITNRGKKDFKSGHGL